MLRTFLPVSGLALALGLSVSAAAAGDLAETTPPQPGLNADEVRVLLAGNTMDAVTALERFKGKAFRVHIRADGTLTIANFSGTTDTGEWEVTEDGHYCNQYANTRKKMRKCFTVHRDPGAGTAGRYELRTRSGALSSRFTVRQGNPDNL